MKGSGTLKIITDPGGSETDGLYGSAPEHCKYKESSFQCK
jgi:superfamily I DNA and RNA helicase